MALFGFLGGKKTSVGLDIGSGIIKLVVVDHSGSEPELAKVATTEVAADAIVEGEVMDPGIVAEAIRGLFSAAGVKQKSVVTAVGGRDVIVKKIQMDRMKEADAREVIRWEAEQHVPFDMANVELDFQILDPGAVRGGAGRGDRRRGRAGCRVPRDRLALGGRPGAGLHDRRRGADSGPERGARQQAQSAGRGREPGAAAQGARRGIRVRVGG